MKSGLRRAGRSLHRCVAPRRHTPLFARGTAYARLLVLAAAALSGITFASNVEPRVERLDANHVVIVWQPSAPVDLYVSDRPDEGIETARLLAGDEQSGRYVASVADTRRSYFLIRNRAEGGVLRVSERTLPLERGSNFRDLGGYATHDGRRIRWGLIYRSAATPLLTDRDVSYVRALGLRSIIDLRSNDEREVAPTRLGGEGVRYLTSDYTFFPRSSRDTTPTRTANSYRQSLTAMAPEYQTVFRELVARQTPIVYNCTAGQDRTGIASALILLALGVPRDTILQDYHLSTLQRQPQNEVPAFDAAAYPDNAMAALLLKGRTLRPAPLYDPDGRSRLADVLDEIDSRWGSIDGYLEAVLGLNDSELAALRAAYLE